MRLLSDNATEPTMNHSEQLRMTELMQYVEKHLPPITLQIFRLRYLREMTCQEVADTMGVSRQTVHNHLRESIEHIRLHLKTIQ